MANLVAFVIETPDTPSGHRFLVPAGQQVSTKVAAETCSWLSQAGFANEGARFGFGIATSQSARNSSRQGLLKAIVEFESDEGVGDVEAELRRIASAIPSCLDGIPEDYIKSNIVLESKHLADLLPAFWKFNTICHENVTKSDYTNSMKMLKWMLSAAFVVALAVVGFTGAPQILERFGLKSRETENKSAETVKVKKQTQNKEVLRSVLGGLSEAETSEGLYHFLLASKDSLSGEEKVHLQEHWQSGQLPAYGDYQVIDRLYDLASQHRKWTPELATVALRHSHGVALMELADRFEKAPLMQDESHVKDARRFAKQVGTILGRLKEDLGIKGDIRQKVRISGDLDAARRLAYDLADKCNFERHAIPESYEGGRHPNHFLPLISCDEGRLINGLESATAGSEDWKILSNGDNDRIKERFSKLKLPIVDGPCCEMVVQKLDGIVELLDSEHELSKLVRSLKTAIKEITSIGSDAAQRPVKDNTVGVSSSLEGFLSRDVSEATLGNTTPAGLPHIKSNDPYFVSLLHRKTLNAPRK